MPLEAVIFAVDGVLAETEETHRLAFNRAFADLGYDWTWPPERYRELLSVEGGLERIRAFVEANRPQLLARMEQTGALKTLHDAKTRRFQSMMEDSVHLRPGVARLLRDLKANGVRLGICTTTSRRNFEGVILATFGFEALDWFSAVVANEDVAARKPDPAPYLETIRRIGVDPARIVAIEASGAGVASARAAGLTVVAAPGRYTAGDDYGPAYLTLSDLAEPAEPFDVLSGDALGMSYTTTEALSLWLDHALAAAPA